jgi:hypothetical protein
MKIKLNQWALSVLLATAAVGQQAAAANYADHFEFDAELSAPYRADQNGRRDIAMQFNFPGADIGTAVAWRLELLSPSDRTLRVWHGTSALTTAGAVAHQDWFEHDPANGLLPAGVYSMRLSATTLSAATLGHTAFGTPEQRIDAVLRSDNKEVQTWPIQIGEPARPAMPRFQALPMGATTLKTTNVSGPVTQRAAAAGGLPYTVYLGNLHSQTNHSDGGGALSTCTGSQNPQAGAFGPTDAFTYAQSHVVDILVASEHNHLFDGSTGTNASANPTTVRNLYQSGLTAARNYNSAHPTFLGVYGMEWGVINNGGHLNIFNSNSLLAWESNSSGQLLGDLLSPQSNYGALYTQMRSNGWIGQFNHPATTGQFVVNGTNLAYTADGDQVMVLCEVMNTSAFSTNTTETETSRTSYETACNRLLTAGYHVAFSTDQDNHCANWGASYTNRTGVLIPNGTALSQAAFVAALRARRVYASTDRTSQLILTANGHVMGETFTNTGSLTLTMNYAPGAGRSATKVQIFQGVPRSNGSVTQLSTTATTTTTPAAGAHFYYAKITQNNGTILWSAPIWVNQN